MDDLEPKQSADSSESLNTDTEDKSGKDEKSTHPLKEILETLIIAILIFALVRSLVLNFRVDGPSMLPTFTDGELVLVNRNAYGEFDLGDLVDWIPGVPEQQWFTIADWGEPQRGDVIVFTPPEPGDQKPYIKRVIGLPGDRVQITEDRVVYVNGVEIEEGYIGDRPTGCTNDAVNCDVTVPPGYLFTLGDNRTQSQDSRYYGLVSEDRIIGKAWLVYWPVNSISTVDSPDYPELDP